MKPGTDGMQPHVQGSATPEDLFKRTIGPLRKWSDSFTKKPEWDGVLMLQANLNPWDDAASQLHTSSTRSSRSLHNPRQHAREEENKEKEVDCVGKTVARKQHIKSFSMSTS